MEDKREINKENEMPKKTSWQEVVIGALDILSESAGKTSKKLADMRDNYIAKEPDERTATEKTTDFIASLWAESAIAYESAADKLKTSASKLVEKKDEKLVEKRREKAQKECEKMKEEVKNNFEKEFEDIKNQVKEEFEEIKKEFDKKSEYK